MSTARNFRALLCSFAVGLLFAQAAQPAALVRSASGANAAAIQAAVDSFRAELGAINNGVGGGAESGRREINWDGVSDTLAVPNFLPADFFNNDSPRGVVFSTVNENNGSAFNLFLVSADNLNSTNTPVRFANYDPGNAVAFKTFSGERLFHIRASQVMQAAFFVPGTATPAAVGGFGLVFADVDDSAHARLTCYAVDGSKLVSASAPAANNGLSFLGIVFSAGERCARVEIRAGNRSIDSGDADGVELVDLIAIDDLLFGEPRSIAEVFKDGFE